MGGLTSSCRQQKLRKRVAELEELRKRVVELEEADRWMRREKLFAVKLSSGWREAFEHTGLMPPCVDLVLLYVWAPLGGIFRCTEAEATPPLEWTTWLNSIVLNPTCKHNPNLSYICSHPLVEKSCISCPPPLSASADPGMTEWKRVWTSDGPPCLSKPLEQQRPTLWVEAAYVRNARKAHRLYLRPPVGSRTHTIIRDLLEHCVILLRERHQTLGKCVSHLECRDMSGLTASWPATGRCRFTLSLSRLCVIQPTARGSCNQIWLDAIIDRGELL